MRVAVTGASGFVGGAIVRALQEEGHQVWSFSRRPAAGTWQAWDISAGPLATPVRVEAVVHAAAAVGDRLSAAAAWQATVVGTAHVCASFPGVPFVHISSSSVYDPQVPSRNAREEAAPLPASRYRNAYGRAKAGAEVLVRGGTVRWGAQVLGRGGRDSGRARPQTAPVTILRPHAVYGPRDTTLLPRLEAAVRAGWLVLPRAGRVWHRLTHIDNLTAAVLGALAGQGSGRTLNVGDAEPVLLAQVLREYFARRALPVRLAPLLAPGLVAAVAEHCGPMAAHFNRYLYSQLGMERTYCLKAWKAVGGQPLPTRLEWVRPVDRTGRDVPYRA